MNSHLNHIAVIKYEEIYDDHFAISKDITMFIGSALKNIEITIKILYEITKVSLSRKKTKSPVRCLRYQGSQYNYSKYLYFSINRLKKEIDPLIKMPIYNSHKYKL